MASQQDSNSPPFQGTPSYSFYASPIIIGASPPIPSPGIRSHSSDTSTPPSVSTPARTPARTPSTRTWSKTFFSLEHLRKTKIQVPVIWSEEYGVWGRVTNTTLLTYAHLIHVIGTKSEGVGYQKDIKENVKNKTYGVGASKNGFQNINYFKAINALIKHGVCIIIV